MDRYCNSYLDKTFEALDNLTALVGSNALPIVHQIGFYLSETKRLEEKDQKLEKIEGVVFDFIHNSFKELLTCFFTANKHIKEFTLTGKGENYSFSNWNKIFETLPGLLQVINFFQIENEVELILEDNGIRVITCLVENQNITGFRKKCYAILRDLIKKKTLLTYKITKNDNIKLDLFLNISHSEDMMYECLINQNRKIKLGFSNIFEQYQISEHEAASLPLHLCLEITEDLQLKKHQGIPKQFTQVLGEFQIIHFSFLFRLVSIIIPFRGKLIKTSSHQRSGDTGRGDTLGLRRDVNVLGMHVCRYVDLFKIISD
ncbi:MAG: hypothetical protein A2381_12915 [Bdellovibrionales bacterium RIFOXYB1_FULL_37_110]|nr:MAG: hypothetical protein A2181_02240 [Bdellovibrionales bacterium RIFOXYA1_FULL_38_20]OFZ51608.1 MAG: hypothetical protein A2417_12575 [Bdellovibrionales bacterium RIFOXYC1_FULL_37_79]OFZ60435.1 MAG: hypothetical protein A2381_12915 [Bdellovibrionales bacterium RIFOXYB1_FULL_37_110]OFZ65008.1 MAG: hypothetical protein A2577_09180 [Bdellovibrionales bacterium RIFOXYD1_FULL_36_51]OFZ67928.1 MAG: hypothetical protein A2328_08410 [Bdellovibrionales bacterium RIFOXYB2_FULL_36_6]